MVEKMLDLLVVGAGISGLGLARMARRRGCSCLVVEAGSHIGGVINSHRFDTPEGEIWAELGAHTCYNSYGNLLQLLEESGQLDTLRAKEKLRYWMQIGERLTSIPSQLNILELAGVLPRLLLQRKAGRSARDYFGGLIGQRNYRQVLGPALDAVVCQPAGDFPAEALFRRKPRRKEIMRSYTGPGGLHSFIDGMVYGLDIRVRTPAVAIEREAVGYRVALGNGESLLASRLALAVAPDIAAKLLRELMPDLARRLGEIGMAEVESRAVLLRADVTSLPRLAGIIGRDDDFYSVVSRDPIADGNYRAFTFHFQPDRLDEAEQRSRICGVLGIEESQLLASTSVRNRLPALRLGQEERVAWIDSRLQGEGLGLTGNWFQGLSIEDSLIRSASEAQRLLDS